MKNLITLLILDLISFGIQAQQTHTLTGYDNYFDPDTLYITAGDTVEFVNMGYHSATEIDSLDWVNNTANHNGGFYVGFGASTSDMKFAIDQAGTYYNICVPHASLGMKSIIVVQSASAGINSDQIDNAIKIYPNPSNSMISFEPSTSVKVYDISGQLVLEKSSTDLISTLDISELKNGTYCLITDVRKNQFIKE